MLLDYRGKLAQPDQPERRRKAPLLSSAAIHLGAFFWFVGLPGVELPKASESEYKQAFEGKEEKIVWYRFKKKLPTVTPPKTASEDKRPLKAETLTDQAVVSSPKDAPQRQQTIWTPEPPELAPKPLDSPNLLAIKQPEATLPPRPFEAPPRAADPVAQAPTLAPEAPLLEAKAPDLNLKLPAKSLLPPPIAQRTASVVKALPEAPQLAAVLTPGGTGLPTPESAKLPPRPFTAPPGSTRTTTARGVSMAPAPPVDSVANSPDLNVAIIGLNPTDRPAVLPAAPNPAAFSSGPKLNPNGATTEAGGKGLSVPDLFVKGPKDNKPDLMAAYRAPTAPETLRAAMNGGEPVMTTVVRPAPTAAPRSAATKVSGAPDPRFNGRDVFMMAIQMPNLTSYSGSWLMCYADRTARGTGLAPIAAPVAHRKVDPKYIATAVEERIEGNVTLGCVIGVDGKVTGVEVIRGLDDRLNQSALEALSKWEFYPATREGQPITVDVLVQIPFRLAPLNPKR